MIIEKPFGTTLRGGARAQPRRCSSIFDGVPGLPHRPLPGQGDRPEHAGVPLRQRHVRAAVEPQLHRQRPDHRRRGPRHRLARRLLRPRGRAAGPDPEPHAAAALPRGDGAARSASPPKTSATRRSRSCTRSPNRRRARSPRSPSGRSTRPGHAGGEDVPGYLRRGGRAARTPTPRPTPRCAWKSTTGAGRACPSTCAPASAWRARSPRSPSRSSPSPTSPSARTARWACAPTSWCSRCSPTRASRCSLGAKIPGTRMIIRPVNMEFQYGTSFLSQSPEAYERLITDAMRGDATLFTRNDEVEAQWRMCDPIVSAWARLEPGPLPTYAAGSQGPEEADGLLLGGRPLARDLMAGRHDAVWSAEATTPTRSKRRCASCWSRRHADNDQRRAGAGAEHDRVRGPRLDGRDRQPPARGRALPRLAHAGALLRAAPRAASTRA